MSKSFGSNGQATAPWHRFWRQDVLASMVVFLVALPLCMGIALASGAPVATGLATGIIGGLVVGFLAGSPLQVSGPAAGLTVICGEVIRQHGVPALGTVVLIAGVLQLLAGMFRLGQWFRAVSPAVIHAMLSGIGLLIVSSQLHVMVDDRPRETAVRNIVSIPETLIKGLPIPAIEPRATRSDRIEMLQTFGALHEHQDEIERGLERIVTRHGSKELYQWEQDHLADFVPAQRAVLEDLARRPLGSRLRRSARPTVHEAGISPIHCSMPSERCMPPRSIWKLAA